jgi:hypothetical protein
MRTVALPAISEETAARFWSFVPHRPVTGCWEWQGSRLARGYGSFKIASYTPRLAHRVSYAIAHDGHPEGVTVRHHCDNPPCVRPDHLASGTTAENAADMVAKGRHYSVTKPEAVLRGEQHGRAKLTLAAVLDIRRRLAGGTDAASIALEYGVTRNLIYAIAHRRIWTSLSEED